MIDLDELIRAANDLDPLPGSATKLAALVADENSTMRQIEEVIQFDPALTAKLLRAANSAARGGVAAVTTAKAAVMRLGTGTVLSLCVGSAVQTRMQRAIPEYGLSEGELWRHSMAAALAAQAVKDYSKRPVPPESFTAALLHDIGKLVMSRFLSPDVMRILARAHREGGLTSMQAEREILGVHHGELGGLIAQHWKLPHTIMRGISYHHSPEEVDDPICYVVYLANQAALTIGTARDVNTPPPPSGELAGARAELGLSAENFDTLCAAVQKRMVDVSTH